MKLNEWTVTNFHLFHTKRWDHQCHVVVTYMEVGKSEVDTVNPVLPYTRVFRLRPSVVQPYEK